MLLFRLFFFIGPTYTAIGSMMIDFVRFFFRAIFWHLPNSAWDAAIRLFGFFVCATSPTKIHFHINRWLIAVWLKKKTFFFLFILINRLELAVAAVVAVVGCWVNYSGIEEEKTFAHFYWFYYWALMLTLLHYTFNDIHEKKTVYFSFFIFRTLSIQMLQFFACTIHVTARQIYKERGKQNYATKIAFISLSLCVL